jgi:hypothetical protein
MIGFAAGTNGLWSLTINDMQKPLLAGAKLRRFRGVLRRADSRLRNADAKAQETPWPVAILDTDDVGNADHASDIGGTGGLPYFSPIVCCQTAAGFDVIA